MDDGTAPADDDNDGVAASGAANNAADGDCCGESVCECNNIGDSGCDCKGDCEGDEDSAEASAEPTAPTLTAADDKHTVATGADVVIVCVSDVAVGVVFVSVTAEDCAPGPRLVSNDGERLLSDAEPEEAVFRLGSMPLAICSRFKICK